MPRQELKTIAETIEPPADAFSSLKNYAKPLNHKNGAVAGLHTQTGSSPYVLGWKRRLGPLVPDPMGFGTLMTVVRKNGRGSI